MTTLNKDQDKIERLKTLLWIIIGFVTLIIGWLLFESLLSSQVVVIGFAMVCIGALIAGWCLEEYYRKYIKN